MDVRAKKIANPSVCVSTMPEHYREASTSVTAGGGSRIRTGDMLLAKQPLYQLSYTPTRGTGGPDKNRTCDLVLIRDAL